MTEGVSTCAVWMTEMIIEGACSTHRGRIAGYLQGVIVVVSSARALLRRVTCKSW